MKKSIYTLNFWLLCISSFLFFSSFNMLIPELPDYLSNLGGEDYKGLIISLFTLTAGISRPFSGKLTDQWGRIPIMVLGSLVCVVMSLMYPIVSTVIPFLAIRLLHGFSTGFKPTATVAYISDIVPENRRGEALGVHGFIGGLGMAVGPALGSEINIHFPIEVLFYVSSAFALFSVIIILNMKETLPKHTNSFKLTKADFFDSKVFPAALIIALSYFSYGVVLTISPDFSKLLGFQNKGIYFLVFTIATLLVRIFAGKWSDLNGRVPVLQIGAFTAFLGMAITAFSNTPFTFLLAAFIYGLGMGIMSPIAQAWTIDLADKEHKGRGVATMFIFLELGIGLGAFFPTYLYQNDSTKIHYPFLAAALFCLFAILYLFYYKRRKV